MGSRHAYTSPGHHRPRTVCLCARAAGEGAAQPDAATANAGPRASTPAPSSKLIECQASFFNLTRATDVYEAKPVAQKIMVRPSQAFHGTASGRPR